MGRIILDRPDCIIAYENPNDEKGLLEFLQADEEGVYGVRWTPEGEKTPEMVDNAGTLREMIQYFMWHMLP
jgi:hypothetical protein